MLDFQRAGRQRLDRFAPDADSQNARLVNGRRYDDRAEPDRQRRPGALLSGSLAGAQPGKFTDAPSHALRIASGLYVRILAHPCVSRLRRSLSGPSELETFCATTGCTIIQPKNAPAADETRDQPIFCSRCVIELSSVIKCPGDPARAEAAARGNASDCLVGSMLWSPLEQQGKIMPDIVRALALMSAIFLLAAPPGFAQKSGGVLRFFHRDSPASGSIHEEATISAVAPFMGVFNNLVLFNQHEKQNRLEFIEPELAESWSWNDDYTRLTFKLRQGRQMA